MQITGFSAGFSATSSNNTQLFLNKLNANYSTKVVLRQGNRLSPRDSCLTKTPIVLQEGFVRKASASEELAEALEGKLEKLHGTRSAFSTLNKNGFNLSVSGFTVDRKGNVTCHGRDNKEEQNFAIDLGKIDDRVNYKTKIYDHFGISATDLLLAGAFKQ